jgi:hypothetical protein
MIARALSLLLAVALLAAPLPLRAASGMDPAAKRVLTAYVDALQHEHYDDAFKLLTSKERTYFRTPANFASGFVADGLHITSFRIIGSRAAGKLGVVGIVSEKIAFFDHAHQTTGTATVSVPYGVVPDGSAGLRIKDPYHPWKAFRTPGIDATAGGLKVSVRKMSFFTGRIEVLLTFANLADGFVTLLPYGRSVLRGDDDTAYHPIATAAPALTDKSLYMGMRLARSAQYSGTLNFYLPPGATPKHLQLTVAPNLRDGGDAPFDVALPVVAVP